MATHSITKVARNESQAGAPRLTMSLAAFVLVCFFLPWVQMSCIGMEETASGVNLARDGERALWLAPLAMLLVLLAGLAHSIWKPINKAPARKGGRKGGAASASRPAAARSASAKKAAKTRARRGGQ